MGIDATTKGPGEGETGLLSRLNLNRNVFRRSYACCAVTRNRQILGAFGFPIRKKNKRHFEPDETVRAHRLIN